MAVKPHVFQPQNLSFLFLFPHIVPPHNSTTWGIRRTESPAASEALSSARRAPPAPVPKAPTGRVRREWGERRDPSPHLSGPRRFGLSERQRPGPQSPGGAKRPGPPRGTARDPYMLGGERRDVPDKAPEPRGSRQPVGAARTSRPRARLVLPEQRRQHAQGALYHVAHGSASTAREPPTGSEGYGPAHLSTHFRVARCGTRPPAGRRRCAGRWGGKGGGNQWRGTVPSCDLLLC